MATLRFKRMLFRSSVHFVSGSHGNGSVSFATLCCGVCPAVSQSDGEYSAELYFSSEPKTEFHKIEKEN